MWKRKFGFSLLILLIYLSGIYLLFKSQKNIETNTVLSSTLPKISLGKLKKVQEENDTSIGLLSIQKIHLEKKLYPIQDSKNNIEQNVTILKESTYPNVSGSKLYLAAHSGTSKNSYFEQLDLLSIGDSVDIIFENKKYTYQIHQIEKQNKTGKIKITPQPYSQVILTTCDPKEKNQQLILIADLKKEQT